MKLEEGKTHVLRIRQLQAEIQNTARRSANASKSEATAHQIHRQAEQARDALDRMALWVGADAGLLPESPTQDEHPMMSGYAQIVEDKQ